MIHRHAVVPLLAIPCALFFFGSDAPPIAAATPQTRLLQASTDKPRAAQHLKGEAAEAFIATLMQRYPSLQASMEQSAIQLREKGWRYTGSLNIAKVGDPPATTTKTKLWPKLKQMVFPVVAAQDTAATGEGYVALWEWDDGDGNTWEGQILSEVYYTGIWQYSSEQMDIASDPSSPYVLWSEMHNSAWVGHRNMLAGEEIYSPVRDERSSTCQPSLKSVKLGGGATMPACGCGGCNWKYRYKFGVNACWQRSVFGCLGRTTPQVVAGCSVVGRVGGGLFGECIVGAGAATIVGCHTDAVIERFNACGWCG